MKEEKQNSGSECLKTNPQALNQKQIMDRNRSILFARDLLSLNDWLIVSAKLSLAERSLPGDASKLLSLAVLGPGERVLLDLLVKPDGAINPELSKKHGLNARQTFNAPGFAELHQILRNGFAGKRVLAFKPQRIKDIFDDFCKQEKLPEIEVSIYDMQFEYSRFCAEPESNGTSYKKQSLARWTNAENAGIQPLDECKQVYKLLTGMASSSQTFDSASTFNKNWSAAFYKPKLGPAEKIKEILGLNQDR